MSNPLHAEYYADAAIQQKVEVVENVKLARDTYRVRFHCPEIAARIVPGQFLMLRLAGMTDPLIGRPLALYDTVPASSGADSGAQEIDVVYLVKGKMTSRLVGFQPGQWLDVWGPLGNGFAPRPTGHLIMVAGGIGQTPFVALAQEALGKRRYGDRTRQPARSNQVTLCYGARTAELLAGVEDFQRAGVDVRIATDDGSRGHHGLVTDLLRQTLAESDDDRRIICCGPEPMMVAVAGVAAETETPCQISLETPMACGIGICFTCVAKVRDANGQWDYKRTCVDGPVFDATSIVW
ncbi:MAG: dihydroorotate dehydrogenase electron transfer subunit [Pirellulaceae bacterium]|jgi:dihydroorotate dehydrogenase electron transfer subunit|nr:dihydroorotate dehydrogenase electron transfer subunit [Planctomycetaceae bacterium]MDP6467560.1 dihydroorotate dehydrogenase electron transfer subunit [Pirellulaceae bacterium]MDP6556715.1 dihydroorotate dehydrogenase electron transfer subunit [Pirellulaceae bacterium]